MPDINPLFTTQTMTAATGQPLSGSGNILGKGTGIFGAGSFFDLMFSLDPQAGKNESGDLALTASLWTPAAGLEAPPLPPPPAPFAEGETLALTLEGGIDHAASPPPMIDESGFRKLNAVLDSLLQGIPADRKPADGVIHIQPGQMKRVL